MKLLAYYLAQVKANFTVEVISVFLYLGAKDFAKKLSGKSKSNEESIQVLLHSNHKDRRKSLKTEKLRKKTSSCCS